MTTHIAASGSTGLVKCTLVSNSLPPRNPNDDNDEEDDDEDEDQDEESPVIREPDE